MQNRRRNLTLDRLLNDFSFHIARNWEIEDLENRWRYILDLQTLQLPGSTLASWWGCNEDSVLAMIGVIGAGIILKRMDGVPADRTSRAPSEVTKINHQVRRYTIPGLIQFFRSKNLGTNRTTFFIRNCFNLFDEL